MSYHYSGTKEKENSLMRVLLHGGNMKPDVGKNREFFRQVLTIEKPVVRVLMVYYSVPLSQWDEKQERDEVHLMEAAKQLEVDLSVRIANWNVKEFLAHLEEVDVVFFAGGPDMARMQTMFMEIPQLKERLQDKTVVGSSVGAYLLSSAFASRRYGILEGFGIVPYNVMCHYNISRSPVATELKNKYPENPTILLEEGGYFLA